ncbi:MAG TPA: phosphatidylserine/phosphatidylglycerophosphate/cardiolipin synthase family protein [Kofleriaceae bacterium]|jgi:phosphatidylserine/phosphatidylglycerophosphate/cardiolipin synthase-like enzyme
MRALLALLAACASKSASAPAPTPLVDPDLQLLVTPAPDHAAFVQAIDGAKASIELAMFHLTDHTVLDALVRAAGRGVAVRVILDGASLKDARYDRVAQALSAGHVQVRGSSPAFSITHEKAMIVDRAVAFITAINLTRDEATTRDFGVITRAPGVVGGARELFDADWSNAASGGNATPVLAEPSLVVSPGARQKLVGLVAAAKRDAIATVENLGDPGIADALMAAAKRGVRVRVIVPLCDKGLDPLYNLAPARRLAAAGVGVRTMPAPETAHQPYMHSKLIQIDGATTFVGSENFSINSLTKARELGVIFANAEAALEIENAFEADWAAAIPPPAGQPDCENSESTATSGMGSGV